MARKRKVTIAEVQEAAELTSRKSVIGWVKAGLLPPPTVEIVPGGRGRRGVWPVSVLQRIRSIRDLTEKGFSLAVVLVKLWQQDRPQAAEVKRKVNAIVRRWLKGGGLHRKGKLGPRALPRNASIRDEWRAAILIVLTTEVGLSNEAAMDLAIQASERKILERALYFYLCGYEPVIVIAGKLVSVDSSATIGWRHSFVHRAFAHRQDSETAHITIQLYGLIFSSLELSGDERSVPRSFLIPAVAVDELDRQGKHAIRYKANLSVEEDGWIGVTLSHGEMLSGPWKDKLTNPTNLTLVEQELVRRSTAEAQRPERTPGRKGSKAQKRKSGRKR